ncbi:MAG: type IV pilus twitching motility protein PilT [Elusimicrobiota bacterium]
MTIEEMLQYVKMKGGSDLHITADSPAAVRIDGLLMPLPGDPMDAEQTRNLIYSILAEEQKRRFEETNELDAALTFQNMGRFRINVFRQKGATGAVLRVIQEASMTFEQLGLPAVIYEVAKLSKGLVLVTGPTGCGKTTTLASIINFINENRSGHIMTIEDPIEFLHHHKRCLINQREVGQDTQNFATALRHILRQDPDTVLIGELRDLETIQTALNIAETGHIVFATLHTNDATQSVNRIIDVFPAYQQEQVRVQLSFVLEAVFCQQLLAHASGNGRVMACEVLIATPAVRNMVREAKVAQIPSLIQTGTKFGMQTMNHSLAELYRRKLILYDTALNNTPSPEDLKRLIDERAAKAAK